MQVCFCHAFNTKTVQDAIQEKFAENSGEKIRAKDIHQTCSGGGKPSCGQCFKHIAAQIKQHQAVQGNKAKEQSAPKKTMAGNLVYQSIPA